MLSIGNLPWLLVGLVGLAAFIWSYHRGPDQNWDLDGYHYFLGYSLFHWRFARDLAPAEMQSFYHPLPCALVYAVFTYLPFPFGAWFITALQASSLPLLMLIGCEIDRDLRHQIPGLTIALALALCVAAPMWWCELGTSLFSSTTAPLVLLALLLGLRGITKVSGAQRADANFVVAGCLMGFAAGLKLTNAPYAIGLLVALAMVLFPIKPRVAARAVLLCALGTALGFAPTSWWNVILYRQWGNPVFPYYNGIFKSPYADPINWRDARWTFYSIVDFARFLVDAVRGTKRTSEQAFADARMLIFMLLLIAAGAMWIVRYFRAAKASPSARRMVGAFMWFFCSSFAIWAVVFVYQRYLSPLELLFGIAIWILVSDIFESPTLVAVAMMGCIVLSLATIKVPNWGHKKHARPPNYFGFRVGPRFTAQPADYLIYGEPVTYLLAFFDPDSRYFGIGYKPQIDRRVAEAIAQDIARDPSREVRVLTRTQTTSEALQKAGELGFLSSGRIPCYRLRTDIGVYLSCTVRAAQPELSPRRVSMMRGKTKALAGVLLALEGTDDTQFAYRCGPSDNPFRFSSGERASALFEVWDRKSRERQILYRVRHAVCAQVPVMRCVESAARKVLRTMFGGY